MKLAAIIAAVFALWFISFKLFTRDSDKRCGWHPDGRN